MSTLMSETRRPRRRGAILEQAILRAAVDELLASGYPGMTMDGVARRAGTNKNAIYRRWPSRAALGVAAYRQLTSTELRIPDTGALRTDALELLRRANSHLASPLGEILRGLLAHAADDPELLDRLRDRSGDAEIRPWLTILERAVGRGEVAAAAVRPRVAAVPIALLRNEFASHGVTSVREEVLVEIIDAVYLPLLRGYGS
ncbi:TetR/AcrR family transcriptional regulator [Nocardia sp. CDC159]|uniref:TetR/AcrR family transcriptional regulator n=1 Tax=Nocardia pulmonis TaxID=2951408 RepID=A0A9X2EEU7_9NOCA|nr:MULTISPECIES: TetR/AcrR family transcriptional regulator [Nocardia]MCM6778125.1 TetR/AcrR family transcriptional regulator [Nocardia pulmonis]MCM6791014.1 TetR/AcrR family transcriptional regulator [Nocardia sp. CDC159]